MPFKPLAKKGIIDTSTSSAPGQNGKSAYELAVENGFSGTLSQWLLSLIGEAGPSGNQGIPGNPGNPGSDGREVEFQKTATHIQWRYVGGSWTDLVALVDIKGDQGVQGNPGSDGTNGTDGTDGVAVELQKTATHVQWRYVGGSWTNLIALSEITGPQGNPGATIGYTINVQALTSSPADGATVYFGTMPKAPVTAAATSKIYIRKAGTIKIAEIYVYSGTAGSNENWSLYIRKNNSTDTLIATLGVSTNERVFSNTGLSIPVAVGDYIEIKGVQPTWGTNPLTTIYGGYIYIE